MAFEIANKVALVTGANRGIGKAIVEMLLTQGATKVYLAVRDTNSTTALQQQHGDKVVTVALDLSSEAALAELAKQANDVDIVVNNAGVAIGADPLADNMLASLATEMEVNVNGLIRIAQAFAPQLEARQGALVQLNSVASLRSNPKAGSYCVSKAASYSVTQALRKSWLDKGVTVMSVHPGPIATDMASDLGLDAPEGPETVADAIAAAFKSGDFHVYPDRFAQAMGDDYASFADKVVLG